MKMNLSKKNIKSILILSSAVFNFIALAFTTLSASHKTLGGIEKYFANGFTLAFSDCPLVIEDIGGWLGAYSKFHFFASSAVILLLATVALFRRSLDFGGFGVAAVIISLVTSLVYMINGIAANVIASDYATLYYEHYTLAPIGFALVLISALSCVFVHLFMADEDAVQKT